MTEVLEGQSRLFAVEHEGTLAEAWDDARAFITEAIAQAKVVRTADGLEYLDDGFDQLSAIHTAAKGLFRTILQMRTGPEEPSGDSLTTILREVNHLSRFSEFEEVLEAIIDAGPFDPGSAAIDFMTNYALELAWATYFAHREIELMKDPQFNPRAEPNYDLATLPPYTNYSDLTALFLVSS